MKGLLSKEHYRYKRHTSLMKSSVTPPPVYLQTPYMDYPPPFLQEHLQLYKQGGCGVGVHTMNNFS